MRTFEERHAEFKAALVAVREAIDSMERAEYDYYRMVGGPYQSKAYIQQQRLHTAGMLKAKTIDEATETIEHLCDALNAWWPIGRPVWSGRD